MSWSDPCSYCGRHRADCDCDHWGEINPNDLKEVKVQETPKILAEKLKLSVIEHLKRQENDPYMIIKGKSYTGCQLIEEINNETQIGANLMGDLLALTLDLLHRNKLQYVDEIPHQQV